MYLYYNIEIDITTVLLYSDSCEGISSLRMYAAVAFS